VRSWNEQALSTARAKNLSDAQSARLYAMVNVAMYDAVNGILSRHGNDDERDHALIDPTGAPAQGDIYAAAVGAAHAVLVGEFPDRIALYDAQKEQDLGTLGSNARTAEGESWGADVGGQVRAARASDGSSPNETQPAGAGPGQFRASWSGVQFRNLTPFAIADPSIYVGTGPPALNSLDYAGAFAEVKLIGNKAILDAGKLNTFTYWSLGGGTSQPPGAWIQVGFRVTESHPLTLADKTRLFALVSMAMVDTVAPTYTTKFVYRHWRPATAIREADTDGNPFTDPDPTWVPRATNIGTSPEYWSGHSSFSGAGAAALAGFFCADNIAFTLVTDSAPGGQGRMYSSFSAAADEAGLSRVVGGIHFNFSNLEGLASGRAVAAEILANKLLLERGPTHFGQCPR
jgi:membrane-associated phospholipid phosphatase